MDFPKPPLTRANHKLRREKNKEMRETVAQALAAIEEAGPSAATDNSKLKE
jgi:hypothetical protein